MTINNNFRPRPERLKFIHLLYFSLSGLDLKFLFKVTGAYYESGLLVLSKKANDVDKTLKSESRLYSLLFIIYICCSSVCLLVQFVLEPVQ